MPYMAPPAQAPPVSTKWGEPMQPAQIQQFVNQYIPMHLNSDQLNFQYSAMEAEINLAKNYNPG
jgi:hypothetical protein